MNGKIMHTIFVVFGVAFAASPTARADIDWEQFECSFNVRFPGYKGSTELTDFPVLIKLSKGLNGFDYSKCAANGSDLRFCNPVTGSLLPSEVDTWNPAGISLVWVKVPSLNSATIVRAYYGFSGVGEPPVVSSEDVWDTNYVGVWHLGEASLPLKESTGTSTAFDKPVNSPIYAQSGAVGGAVDVTSGCLTAPDDDDLDGFANYTIELWTKKTENSNTDNRYILAKRFDGNQDVSYVVYDLPPQSNSTNGRAQGVCTNGVSMQTYGYRNDYPELNTWTYQAYSRTSGVAIDAYHSGTNVYHSTWLSGYGVEPIFAGAAPLTLGASTPSGGSPFPGLIDELRISKVVRSADWIKASYDCVADEDFAVYEACEADNDWTKYSHRFDIRFTGYNGETLENFPVLVKISELLVEGFDYDHCLRANGADLRFADESGTPLASEVDTWDTSGTSLVWVKVPSLSAGTKITAYYGWAFAPQSIPSGVWDSDYVGVWHLGEASVPLKESTGTSTAFDTPINSPGYAQSGAVGGAVDVTSGCLTAPDDDDLDGFANYTIEIWTKKTENSNTDNRYILAKRFDGNQDVSYLVYDLPPKNSNPWGRAQGVCTNGTSSQQYSYYVDYPELGTWTYQAYSRTSGVAIDAYHSGTNVYHSTWLSGYGAEPIFAGAAPLTLGASTPSGGSRFPGLIDELRISKVARSGAWLKATYDTIKNNASFTTYGAVKDNAKHGLQILVR